MKSDYFFFSDATNRRGLWRPEADALRVYLFKSKLSAEAKKYLFDEFKIDEKSGIYYQTREGVELQTFDLVRVPFGEIKIRRFKL